MNFSDEIKYFESLPITIISSFGHNGLDWMHSLLDSHPNISLMPAYSFFRTLDFYEKKYGSRIEDLKKPNEISEKLTSFLYFDPSYQVIRRKFINNDKESKIFKKDFLLFLNNSSHQNKIKKIFYGINYAFCKLYNLDFKKVKMIISQEHVSWHSERYKNIFDPKFIFMMRDPRAGLSGSWKRQVDNAGLKSINPYDFDKGILVGTYLEKFCKKFNRENEKKIKIMKNEKMHKNLRREIENLCEWLELDFNISCLEETFLGVEWLGESSYLAVDELKEKPPVDFYKEDNIENRWRERLSSEDINMIEYIFENSFSTYEYKRDTKKNFLNNFFALKNFLFSNLFPENKKPRLFFLLKILRNFVRRTFVLIFPLQVSKIFKII